MGKLVCPCSAYEDHPTVHCRVVALVLRNTSNEGWPISSEVGNTNWTSEFVIPTAKAMGHPTPRTTCNGTLATGLAERAVGLVRFESMFNEPGEAIVAGGCCAIGRLLSGADGFSKVPGFSERGSEYIQASRVV